MGRLVGLHHVAVTVSDLDRSARWYREVLGLEEVFSEAGAERGAVVMRLPGTGAIFAVVRHDRDPGPFDPGRTGLDHLSFAVATREELDEWADRLKALGVRVDGPVDVPPGAILNFKDPDGIALALFWDRPTGGPSPEGET